MQDKNTVNHISSFMRDVLVNVLANLIAAAVVYLFGAAAGLFPRSPLLIAGSISLGLTAIGIAVYAGQAVFFRVIKRREPSLRVIAWCMILIGAGCPIAPFAYSASLTDKIGYPIIGVGAVIGGVLALRTESIIRKASAESIDKQDE